jgi:hypothetical protein
MANKYQYLYVYGVLIGDTINVVVTQVHRPNDNPDWAVIKTLDVNDVQYDNNRIPFCAVTLPFNAKEVEVMVRCHGILPFYRTVTLNQWTNTAINIPRMMDNIYYGDSYPSESVSNPSEVHLCSEMLDLKNKIKGM